MNSRDDITTKLAMPGAPDLDADVHHLTVTAVVVAPDTQELLVHLTGGMGRYADSHTGDMVDVTATDAHLSGRFPDCPPDVFAGFVSTLERWRDTGALVRMCCAPGRASLLFAATDDILPFPRRPDPEGDLNA